LLQLQCSLNSDRVFVLQLNFIDKEKAKHDAKKKAEAGLADSGEY